MITEKDIIDGVSKLVCSETDGKTMRTISIVYNPLSNFFTLNLAVVDEEKSGNGIYYTKVIRSINYGKDTMYKLVADYNKLIKPDCNINEWV